MAQEDFLLQIEEVDGESDVDPGTLESGLTTKAIQLMGWSFGVTNSGSSGYGTGMGTGKANLSDFSFQIVNGKSSPLLFKNACIGKHVGTAVLTCRKTTGEETPKTYYRVTFTDLVISSFQTGGSSGGGLPMESCTFNFAAIKHEYMMQDTTSGQLTVAATSTHNTKTVATA